MHVIEAITNTNYLALVKTQATNGKLCETM